MSSVDFTLPDLGEGVHEGQVMRLHVQEGDVVSEDQPLMEVETDKAAVEIPSPHSGVVSTIHVAERQLVHVGEVMVTFDCQDVAPAAAPAPEPQQMPLPPQEKTTERLMFPVDKDASTEEIGDLITDQLMASLSPTRRTPCSPSVRKLARTLDIDIATLDGSGSGGRVTREDVEAAAAPALTSPEPMTIADAPAPSSPEPVAIAEAMPPSQPTVATPVLIEEPIEGTSEQDDWGLVMRQPLSQARKAISRAMSTAWETIPHVTDCNDADITELDRLRREFVDPDRPDLRLTILPFVVRAVCRALRKHPILNAAIDAESGDVLFRQYVNIAVGIETDRGLIAPVIRDADQLQVGELAEHLEQITVNARSASFSIADTRGATYTISNAGAMGRTRYSTPIIQPGTVACLALGRSRKMPWVVDDAIVPRLILPLSHSMDHRLVDGGREIPFIDHVINDLEHPMRFML